MDETYKSGKCEDEQSRGEENLLARCLDNAENSRQDIKALTDRCSELVGNNSSLEKQVDRLRSKLDEANSSVLGFEERLQKQVHYEGNMKRVVAQLKDYLYIFEDENNKLKEDLEKMEKAINDLRKEKSQQDLAMAEMEKENKEMKKKNDALIKEGAKCDCKEKLPNNDAKVKELTTEKDLLDEKLRNCLLVGDERSNKIIQLTESNRRLASNVENVQKRLDAMFDEKIQLEQELERKKIECDAKESDLVDLNRRVLATEDKLATKEQQAASITQRLKLCMMANERVDLERRRSDEDLSRASVLITELENKVSTQKSNSEKFKADMKAKEHEVDKLMNECHRLRTGIEEAHLETERLRVKVEHNQESYEKLNAELSRAKAVEKEQQMELEVRKREATGMKEKLESMRKKLANGEQENRLLEEKARKLVADGEKYKEAKNEEIVKCDEKLKELTLKFNALNEVVLQKEALIESSEKNLKVEREESLKSIRKLRRGIRQCQETDTAQRNQISALERDNETLKSEIEGLEKKNQGLKEDLNSAKTDKEGRENEIAKLNEKINNLVNSLKESEQLCKSLKKIATKAKNENLSKTSEVQALKDERNNLSKQLEELKDGHRKLESLMAEQSVAFENLQNESKTREAEIETLRQVQKGNDELIARGKQHVSNLVQEKESLVNHLSVKQEQLESLKQEREQLKISANEIENAFEASEKENDRLSTEEKHLRAKIEDMLTFSKTIESKVHESEAMISGLEARNAALKLERDTVQFEAKDCEREKFRLLDNEKELRKQLGEMEKRANEADVTFAKLSRELHMKEDTIDGLERQVEDMNRKYNKLNGDFLETTEMKNKAEEDRNGAKQDLEQMNEALTELKRNAEVLNRSLDESKKTSDEMKKKYAKKKGEVNEAEENVNELEGSLKKLEDENCDLKDKLNESVKKIQNLESAYEEIRIKSGTMEKEKKEMLKRQDEALNKIKSQEKDFEALASETKSISKELLKVKKNYTETLGDVINQKYLIDELSGSHKYEHDKRVKVEKEIEDKDEEMFEMRQKIIWYDNELVRLKELFESEKGLRVEIANDIKKLKLNCEALEEEKIRLTIDKEEIEEKMKIHASQLKKCLLAEKEKAEDIQQQIDEKNKTLGSYELEMEKNREILHKLEEQLQEAKQGSKEKSDRIQYLERELEMISNDRKMLQESIEEHKNKALMKDDKIKSMQMVANKTELQTAELKDKINSLEKEARFLEKARESSDRRLQLTEDKAREAEKKYKTQCGEECVLRESLKTARWEFLKLLEEKECIEEQKHVLELKLLQGVSLHSAREGNHSREMYSRYSRGSGRDDNRSSQSSRLSEHEHVSLKKRDDPSRQENKLPRGYEFDYDDDEELAAIMKL